MTVAHARPYAAFLELEPEAGVWCKWCAGLVNAKSGGSPEHSRLSARIIALLSTRLGEDCSVFDA